METHDKPEPAVATEPTTRASSLELLEQLEEKVDFYYPKLLPSVKAGLAVFGAMAIGGRTKPLSLIFEATSGFGKSAVVEMYFPEGELARFAYRCDKFTPKAFVSHAANKPRDELKEVDMLPRLKNKVLLTKELAPIFRGREDEIKDNFATLIPVLDGKGFTSDSGSHGKRGYEETILFNWVGATTPLPRETYQVMYQLGTRLLFYEVPSVIPDDEQLLRYAARDDVSLAGIECQRITNQFLVEFYREHSLGSVSPETVRIPEPLLRHIVQWTNLLATVRAGTKREKIDDEWKSVAPNPSEGPYKIIGYFKELARGHALIHGRSEVVGADIELVAHTAISSVPGHFRPILRALMENETVTSTETKKLCNVSAPTARDYLTDLEVLGIVTLERGLPTDTRSPSSYTARLSKRFSWLHHSSLKVECGVWVGTEEGSSQEVGTLHTGDTWLSRDEGGISNDPSIARANVRANYEQTSR